MITEFCIECGSYNINYVTKQELINVKDEEYTVKASYWICSDCKAEFENICEGEDYFVDAYNQYRKKHNMLMPEEIKSIREQYGLTQDELNNLLGLEEGTIYRYENGSLQDIAHDKILKLLQQEPIAVLQLISLSNITRIKDETTYSICRNMANIKYKQSNFYKNIFETV